MKRGIERVGVMDATVEKETELGCVLAVIEVVRDETGEGVGPCMPKGILDTFSVGSKDMGQPQLLDILFSLPVCVLVWVCVCVVILVADVNLGPYLVVGIGLDSEGVFAG